MAGNGARTGEPADSGVIVVGVEPHDFGETLAEASRQAFGYAAGLARLQGVDVVPVWVRPRIAIVETFADTVQTLAHDRDEQEAAFGRTIEKAGADLGVAPVTPLIREGDAFEQLTAVAEAVGAGGVVVGASERRLGSVATRLIRDCRWPVTVVPMRPLGA